VTFTCREGEITGVFGPNGAGKSTLMFTISGIILDMKKTEIMMGGERITILGEIQFRGKTPSMLSQAKEPGGNCSMSGKTSNFP